MECETCTQQHGRESDQANPRSRGIGALTVCWGASLGLLLLGLMAYSQQPGDLEEPPLASALNHKLDHSKHTLFVAIHPRCPCTAASLYELERLIARSNGRLQVTILAYFPGEERDTWVNRNAIRSLSSLDCVTLEWDENGDTASSLGCMTSGSVVLYNPQGEPLFWGGITSARGHAGDNAGCDTILDILNQGKATRRSTPVYGCSLQSPETDASGIERSNE